MTQRTRFFVPGMKIWGRETWAVAHEFDKVAPSKLPAGVTVWYRAGGTSGAPADDQVRGRWRPLIHQPKVLSRIRQTIVAVRDEPLQQIRAQDVVAEGVVKPRWLKTVHPDLIVGRFATLWRQINGPDSWDLNPWVKVIELRRETV